MKKQILTILAIGILIASISFVSAYHWLCLGYGDPYPFPSDRTCWATLCQVCVHENGYATREVYNSRYVLFDIESNEPATMKYLDNINGRGRWKTLCSRCDEYDRSRSLRDGLQDITIKATDINGNSINITRQFSIDSKKPRIYRTAPKKGFADGMFQVQFKEENPTSLKLYYGIFGDMREKNIALENPAVCYEYKKKTYCDTSVDLNDFDGKIIKYWFELEDIAGTVDESKTKELEVDTTFPVLNNPGSFWEQGDGRYNKYIYFTFNVTEKNFDEITYIDYFDIRARERRLCSRLNNKGVCEKRKSFRKGDHVVDIKIIDEAGNDISTERIEFTVM